MASPDQPNSATERSSDLHEEIDRLRNAFLTRLAASDDDWQARLAVLRREIAEFRSSSQAAALEVAIRHACTLAACLLDLERIDAGELTMQRRRIDLGAAAKNGLSCTEPLCDLQTQTLTLSLPEKPLHVEGDPERLAQVVMLLAGRASRQLDRGAAIRVDVARQEDSAVLRVRSDTDASQERAADVDSFVDGKHIPPPMADLGIEETLVHQLVAMQGGAYTCEQAGATVTLPALAPEPERQTTRMSTEDRPQRRLRIVLMDADEDRAGDLELLLRLWGHQVHVAGDASAGLEMITACEPDVILVDTTLPDAGARTVANAIRTHSGTRPLLVALCRHDEVVSKDHGTFDHILHRPLQPTELEYLLSHFGAAPAAVTGAS